MVSFRMAFFNIQFHSVKIEYRYCAQYSRQLAADQLSLLYGNEELNIHYNEIELLIYFQCANHQ